MTFSILRVFFIPQLRWVFLGVFFTFFANASFASHVQGGEITMRCIGANQYEIRLALYRDCAGVNAPGSVFVRYSSASCGISTSVILSKIAGTGQEVTPICPAFSTECTGGSYPGVEEYIYVATVNLSACTDWVFSYRVSARNKAIQTIVSPGGEQMHIESVLNNFDFPCNSTPTFTNKPVPFICSGQGFCFNNGAFDADGDSLYYELTAPLGRFGNPVTYIPPYSATQPLTSSPPTVLDPLTGDVCMTPTAIEVTIFAVLVKEYRNGVQIGEIRRDIQLRTVNCSNTNPYLNGINNTGSYSMNVCAGTPIAFNIPSFDTDAGDDLTLSWNGGISGATFDPGTGLRPTGVFTWTPTGADISNTQKCFTVTVQDDNCPYFATQSYSFCFTVGELTTTTASTNSNCLAADGSISATVTSGVGPFTYLWTPGGYTTSTVNNVTGGKYYLTTSNLFGCTYNDSVVVAVTGGSSASVTSVTNVSCNGDADGKMTVSMAGAGITPPFTYVWTPAVAGSVPSAINLSPVSHKVKITDANGCVDSVTQVITEPAVLTTTVTPSHVGCFGASTGEAVADPAGGTPPYAYLWTPGGLTTKTINLLPIGTYDVTVTDANNCTVSESTTITQQAELTMSAVVTNANCGQADGSAVATGGGGKPPYTYLWSNGQTGATATGLAAGPYTVTITDTLFCDKVFPVTVGDNAGPTAKITTIKNVSCNGGSDGNVTVVASGGLAPYTYLWNNGQVLGTASNLTIGLYSVTITDASGCVAAADSTLTEPTLLTNNNTIVHPICFGASTGTITANPAGGVMPYTYLWSTPGNPTTITATNVPSGTHSVTITDANNCDLTQNAILTNPALVTTLIDKTDALCNSSCDGTAATIISNGKAPFTYSWNDPLGQSTDTAKFLCKGTYTVNIVDDNGCTSQAVTVIDEPTLLTSTVSSQGNLDCYQVCIGFAQVAGSGGTAPYSYLWSNGDITATTTNLCAGTYTCTITDANSCTATSSVTITEPTELTATITGTDIKCIGNCDGTGNIAYAGGTVPYTFLWTPGLQTTPNPANLCVGANTGEVTDAKGCKVSQVLTLTDAYSPIVITPSVTNSNCGLSNGKAEVAVVGGLAPYTYVWNDPGVSKTDSIVNVLSGSYLVDVTDAVGCLRTLSVNINDLASPSITINSQTDLLCYGDLLGAVTSTVTGGALPYDILWSPGGQTTKDPTTLGAGTNTMTVTDNAGCVTSETVDIFEPTETIVVIKSKTNVTCFNVCDGEAEALATGGTGALNYLWTGPSANQMTSIVSGLCDGKYVVTITDANSCIAKDSLVIIEPDSLQKDSSNFSNLSCYQDNKGSVTAYISGGNPFYTYNWTPNVSTTANANGLPAGNYALEVVDQKGCINNFNWTLTEPNELVGIPTDSNATCSKANGGAKITVQGGTAPYTYQWNDPALQTTDTAMNLFAANYNVYVADKNGCNINENYTILDLSGPVIDSVTSTDVLCFMGNTGSASVHLKAGVGTPNFTYAWTSTAQIFPDISGLTRGAYSVTVTDANLCVAGGNVFVDEPPLLEILASQGATICFGDTINIYGQASGGVQPYVYNWVGGVPGIITDKSQDVFPVSTTIYSIDVLDLNNCPAGPQQILITVLPTLKIVATDASICVGDTVQIDATPSGGNGGLYTYSWDNGPITKSQFVSPIYDPAPTKYVITLNDGCSVPVYDTSFVTTYTNPVIDSIVPTDVLCYGESNGEALVYMDALLGTPAYSYEWKGFVPQASNLLTGLPVGTYELKVVDVKNCYATGSVVINQPDTLVLTVVEDSVCYGEVAQISASTVGGVTSYVYTWSGLGAVAGPGPHTVSPIVTTVYTVTVTDANNCTNGPENVTVKVGDPLNVVAQGGVTCEGDSVTISAVPSGGDGTTYVYNWDNGATTATQTVATNVGDVAAMYTITLTDGCSTPAQDIANVVINPKPDGAISASPRASCPPIEVEFMVTTTTGVNFFWNYGDNTSIIETTDNTVKHVYVNSANFDVSLTVMSNLGCPTVIDSIGFIEIYPKPVADFAINMNPTTILETEIIFTDQSYANITNWDWNFANLGNSVEQHPTYTFPEVANNYDVQLIVINDKGCLDTIIKTLTVKPEWALYVPNTFTPDGDGLNEGFGPKGFGVQAGDYQFLIFNRWGELLFDSNIRFQTWNGIYKGDIVEEETYVWKIFFKDEDGNKHSKIGQFTLLK